MYMKTLLGVLYVLHILNNVEALPVSGQSSSALSPDNIDQTMKDAVQTLLNGLLIKGNDLRAELQEEARALLEDPYPFDDETLAEAAQLAAAEAAAAREQKSTEDVDPDATSDSGDSAKKQEGSTTSNPENPPAERDSREVAAKYLRSLTDDTVEELERLYARSAEDGGSHHRFSDMLHLSALANLLVPTGQDFYPIYPVEVPAAPAVPDPTVAPLPDVAPAVAPEPIVPAVDAPIPDVVTPPVEVPLPEVPVPVARSVDADKN